MRPGGAQAVQGGQGWQGPQVPGDRRPSDRPQELRSAEGQTVFWNSKVRLNKFTHVVLRRLNTWGVENVETRSTFSTDPHPGS